MTGTAVWAERASSRLRISPFRVRRIVRIRRTPCSAHIGHFSDYGLLVPADEGIPTVSEWGLIALTLALLAGGKVYFRRRRPVA